MLTGNLYKYKEGKHVDCVKEVLHADNVELLRKSKLARRTVDRLIEGGENEAFQRSTLVVVYDCLKEGAHEFADRFPHPRNFIDEYYEAQEKLGRKKKMAKRGEIEQSVLHQRIIAAEITRILTPSSKVFWDDARSSIELYAVVMAGSLISLTSNSYGESPVVRSLENKAEVLGENLRILLLDPDIEAFELHSKFLEATDMVPYQTFTREIYKEKLRVLEGHLLPRGAQIKYYKILPTVSFVIVDDSRVQVEYLLPYTNETTHATLTFEKGDDLTPILFDVFRRTFARLWNDGERTVSAPRFSEEDAP